MIARQLAGQHMVLGILAHVRNARSGRMPEDLYFRELSAAGAKRRLRIVILSPEAVIAQRLAGESVHGYTLSGKGEWIPCSVQMPSVVYDRRFSRNALERETGLRAMERLRREGVLLLGGAMPGKREVYRRLLQSKACARYIPVTKVLHHMEQLEGLLEEYPGGLFLKPSHGMQGRGVLTLRKGSGSYEVSGRTRSNKAYVKQFHDIELLSRHISAATCGRTYLVQPFLRLMTPDGEPFDMRFLVQKDAKGRWHVTGAAARTGCEGSVTSNLHGGGTAKPLDTLLAAIYDSQAAEQIVAEISCLALRIAEILDRSFGRFAELGLDFGVEPDGSIWFIEANSKPGRMAFRSLQGKEARIAVHRPVEYAYSLICRTSTHNLQEV